MTTKDTLHLTHSFLNDFCVYKYEGFLGQVSRYSVQSNTGLVWIEYITDSKKETLEVDYIELLSFIYHTSGNKN